MEGISVNGEMMDFPLTLHHIFHKNETLHSQKEVVSVLDKDHVHRYTYEDFQKRVRKLAQALINAGVKKGDRIATFGFNHFQHLELYFAIPMVGGILHTVNIRLFSEQLIYIFNHAEDTMVFFDVSLAPLLEGIKDKIPTVKHYIAMCTLDSNPPRTSLPNVITFESFIRPHSDSFEIPHISKESDALGLCYTSGTTGNPKGVLYSHRSTVLSCLSVSHIDSAGLSERDTLLSIVPMFHVNAWSFPFVSVMNGTKIIFLGKDLSPAHITQWLLSEHVTVATGVPTLWLGVYEELKKLKAPKLPQLKIVSGGSAVPSSLIDAYQKELGVHILHAWGMTETHALGTMCTFRSVVKDKETKYKQGWPLVGIEMRIMDDNGKILPWDGKSVGEIQVRGGFIAKSYYKSNDRSSFTQDGWFKTGDVASIEANGYIKIVDRTKDLIKSGGEWISSVELEGIIMSHPKVLESACFAINHDKFVERPMAVIVLKQGEKMTKEEVLKFLEGKIAKWWMPDEIAFVEQIPKTSVGKFDKKVLRAQYSHIKSKL